MFKRRDLLTATVCATLISCAPRYSSLMSSKRPLIIAHRGASGSLPEHTLQGFELAARQGADVLEPDLVMSQDAQLIVRHDHFIGVSSNVDLVFPERRRTGAGVAGPEWFSEDFSALEFAQLRARQPWLTRDQSHNDLYAIPTFAQVLELRARSEASLGRALYVYPELKLPSYFSSIGLDPVTAFVAMYQRLRADEQARVLIQCFEPAALQRLRAELGPGAFLTQLLPAMQGELAISMELDAIARYANAIGPHKLGLIDASRRSTGLLERAHSLGLKVHPWTFRDDQPVAHFNGIEDELRAYFALGVDGVFTDFPDTASRLRS